jgi:hypothetical protein
MKRSLVLFFAVAAAGLLATASAAMHATHRSGALHVTKECSQYDGSVGSFCTITSSNINAIKPGMRVVYLRALANGVLNSDIVLSLPHGSAAFGHVVLDLPAQQGHVTFSGGTGKFARFQADAVVSLDSSGVWHWDGTYSFTRPHSNHG